MKGVIEAAVAVAVVLGSTLIVLNSIMPFIEEGKDVQSFTEAKETLAALDQSMQQLLTEAVGARRQIDLNIRDGKLIVAGDEEKIKLRLEGFSLPSAGATVQEGNIVIQGGSTIDAVEEDINSDGNTDLVLRNSALTLAIRKIGNSTSWASLNTSTMITEIFNNRTSARIRPGSGIYINDNTATAAGNGYTALTNQGKNIESAAILAFVNSSSGITYEALFTLSAGTDFIDLQVKKITGA